MGFMTKLAVGGVALDLLGHGVGSGITALKAAGAAGHTVTGGAALHTVMTAVGTGIANTPVIGAPAVVIGHAGASALSWTFGVAGPHIATGVLSFLGLGAVSFLAPFILPAIIAVGFLATKQYNKTHPHAQGPEHGVEGHQRGPLATLRDTFLQERGDAGRDLGTGTITASTVRDASVTRSVARLGAGS